VNPPLIAPAGFAFPLRRGIMARREWVAADAGRVYHRQRGPLRPLDGRILRAGEEP
jgi:hypothetical protein